MQDCQASEEAFSSQNKTSTLQNMKFLNFFLHCGHFFLLDPDPDFKYRYGSTDLSESGSETLETTSRKITNVVRFSCFVLSVIDFFIMQAMVSDLMREAPVHPGPCRHHQRPLLLSQQVCVRLLPSFATNFLALLNLLKGKV